MNSIDKSIYDGLELLPEDKQGWNGYPQIYYQFLSNVIHNRLQDVITPFPNTSENGYRYLQYKGLRPELIYIDASHEEDDVYKDIKNYFSILKQGGIIFGDDYSNWEGVRNAIRRFKDDAQVTYEVIDDNFWVIKKNWYLLIWN